jgi:transposase
MRKLHRIALTPDQRADLLALTQTGAAPARVQTRARILLKADQGPAGPAWTDARIAEALETSVRTVARLRRAWVEAGATALARKRPRVRTPRKLDGAGEAHLVALTCSPAPAGRTRWTLQLLADKLVGREIVDGIAPNTGRTTPKKPVATRG